jgi:hypothetical protein
VVSIVVGAIPLNDVAVTFPRLSTSNADCVGLIAAALRPPVTWSEFSKLLPETVRSCADNSVTPAIDPAEFEF